MLGSLKYLNCLVNYCSEKYATMRQNFETSRRQILPMRWTPRMKIL